jgi:hypothetical protein
MKPYEREFWKIGKSAPGRTRWVGEKSQRGKNACHDGGGRYSYRKLAEGKTTLRLCAA